MHTSDEDKVDPNGPDHSHILSQKLSNVIIHKIFYQKNNRAASHINLGIGDQA